jgi:MraZ protein
MLLTGTYERALDEKLRLALPKPLREALAEETQLVLTPGTDGSLSLFPGRALADLAEKLAARSPTGRDVRAFSRLLYAQSQSVEVDSQGRIRLSPELVRWARLEGDVILLGVGDRVELWNKSRWEAYLHELQPRYDQLAESALSERPPVPDHAQAMAEPVPRPRQPR